MKLWIVSMECAGIIEAGGVKNVTLALCKEFSLAGNSTTLFIPVFKTNCWDLIYDYEKSGAVETEINHCNRCEKIIYKKAKCKEGDFNIVFINNPVFAEKEDIYTYTENEQKQNPEFIKGKGHKDTLFMDSLFAKAVAEYINFINPSEYPDIIHCQDASCALIPSFVKNNHLYNKTKTVVTIHNAGPAYHHNFSSAGEAAWYTGLDEGILSDALNASKVEPFLLAVNSGAYLTTVSENYAKELLDPMYENETEGLSSIFFSRYTSIKGITNGIDYERYNPTDKNISLLPYEFNPETLDLQGKYECRKYFINEIVNSRYDSQLPVCGSINTSNFDNDVFITYHGRITHQKGINILIDAIPAILNNFDNVKFIICGQGEISLEKSIIEICNKFSGKVAFINGYDRQTARLINCSGDFIVLPSFFEPCGLEDLISQLYGTLPVANKTGGLNKIVNRKTGFLYENNCSENLIAKLSEVITLKINCPEVIQRMIKEAALYVHENYLWKNVIKTKYLPFFEEILKKV